jgi:hypothetical protein
MPAMYAQSAGMSIAQNTQNKVPVAGIFSEFFSNDWNFFGPLFQGLEDFVSRVEKPQEAQDAQGNAFAPCASFAHPA